MPSKNSPFPTTNSRSQKKKKKNCLRIRTRKFPHRSSTIFPLHLQRRFNAPTQTLPQTFPGPADRDLTRNFLRAGQPIVPLARHSTIGRTKIPFIRLPRPPRVFSPRPDRPKRRFHLRIFINEAGIIHSS